MSSRSSICPVFAKNVKIAKLSEQQGVKRKVSRKTEQMPKSATVIHDQIESPLGLASQKKLAFTLVSSLADLIILKCAPANLGKCVLLVSAMMGEDWLKGGSSL